MDYQDFPFLVSIDEVKDRLAYNPNVTAGDENLYSGMVAAHLRVQAEMESEFEPGSATDVFYLDPSYNGVVPDKMFRCKLRNGFLTGTPVVTTGTDRWVAIGDQTTLTDKNSVDMQRGIVYVDESYAGQYITVQYSYGFAGEDDVPIWLKEALIGYVPLLLNFSSVTNQNPEAETMTTMNVQHVMSILAPYRRNIGLCMRPL